MRPIAGKGCWSYYLIHHSRERLCSTVLAKQPYVWDGKIPNSDRIKLITKKGIILSWGCDPPDEPIAFTDIAMLGGVLSYKVVGLVDAHTPPAGLDKLPGLGKASGT